MKIYWIRIDVRGFDKRVFYDQSGKLISDDALNSKSIKPDNFKPDANDIFEAIQNTYSFYDNCTLESERIHSDKEELYPMEIIIEGHNYQQVKDVYEVLKSGIKLSQIVSVETAGGSDLETIDTELILPEESFSLEVKATVDTILSNDRSDTGNLWVRTPEFYDELFDKILEQKKILPILIGIDEHLNELIQDKLTEKPEDFF